MLHLDLNGLTLVAVVVLPAALDELAGNEDPHPQLRSVRIQDIHRVLDREAPSLNTGWRSPPDATIMFPWLRRSSSSSPGHRRVGNRRWHPLSLASSACR